MNLMQFMLLLVNTFTMESNANELKIVKVETSDNVVFDVPEDIIKVSIIVKNMIEDIGECGGAPVPLPNVSGTIMRKIVEYLHYHHDNPSPAEDEKSTNNISPWDAEFCNVEQPVLFELILAANYLDIKSLLDVT